MDVTPGVTDVKGLVRGHYGERARQASSGPTPEMCCGPSAIYSPLELLGLPQTVTAASAGCGDPTALAGIREGEVVLDLGSGGGIDCFIASRQNGKVRTCPRRGHDPGHGPARDAYLDRIRRAGFADVYVREAVPFEGCGDTAGVVSAKVEAARPPD